MRDLAEPWQLTKEGCALRVRVTPGSAADRIGDLGETASGVAVKLRVRAIAADGKANAAAAKVVARWLGLPPSCVAVGAGAKARVKTLKIDGDPAMLSARLTRRLSELHKQ